MTDKGLQSIEQKFLNVGDLFALKFSQGMVFLEVQAWEQIKYSPYDNIGEIEGEDSSGWSRIEDNSDDILYVEKKDKKVLHVGMGQSPSHIRRFTNYPEGEVRLRSLPNLKTPRPGKSFGYIDGNDSPFSDPTDAEELMIPPGVHLDFNFYNADTETHKPLLNIKLREYNVRALNPNNEQDKNAIRRIVSPGSPIPIANVGSMDRQDDFDLEDYWGTRPLSESEVNAIRGGK